MENYGKVIRQFWYTVGHLGFKARCGYCNAINKHGLETSRTGDILESRSCDSCYKTYKFIVSI